MTTPETIVTERVPQGVGVGAGEAGDDDLLDVPPPRRAGRVTLALAAGIVAAVGFGGGVLVQKNHDAGLTSGGGASALREGGGFPGGFAPGGAGGGPGGAQAGGGTGAEGGTGAGSGSGSGSGSAAPAVVGQVVSVSGTTLTVKNFAGKTVTVTVPAGTSVTSAVPLSSLKAGTSVSVTGTAAADGTVTATGVTARAS